jgi:hypothetical protein
MTNLYFFGTSDRIKIGVARDVEKRRRAVGSHMIEPPILLGSMPGTFQLEKFIHAKLVPFRLRGEWFQANDHVRELISTVLKYGPAAIGFKQPAPKAQFAPAEMTAEERAAALRKIMHLMWEDPLGELVALSGYPEQEAMAWLGGAPIPQLVRLAVAGVATLWLMDDKPRAMSFKADNPHPAPANPGRTF